MGKPVTIRRHAILTRHYRRAVIAAADFQTLTPTGQWTMMRDQVQADEVAMSAGLLEILDSRESRRDEVLAALEDARLAFRRQRRARQPPPS